MGKNKVGRPTVMTPEVVNKLEELFFYGHTDEEACLLAGITRQTLNDYQHKHPEFIDRKQALKQNPSALARKVIFDAIDKGDKDMAKWYAERKMKDEFSTKQENDIKLAGEVALVKWK